MSIETLVLRLAPSAGQYAFDIENAMLRNGVTDQDAKWMFLANALHETAGLTKFEENTNYSAKRLMEVFPNRFNPERAAKYARKPKAIASYVYANRLGNGSEATEDGWKFRGRGIFQLTGRDNYRRYSLAHYGDERILAEPWRVAEPYDAAQSAVLFWNLNKCGYYAALGDFSAVCGIINRGSPSKVAIHMKERKQWLAKVIEADALLIRR